MAAALVALPSHAAAGNLGGGLALSSQLIDRGQAITPATPIVQGNLAWTSGGWALGLSGSARIHAPGGHFVEAIAQAAHYWTLSDNWSMQAGLLYYKYPDSQRFFDRTEAGLHWTFRDVLTIGRSATSSVDRESQHDNITELIVADDMHARKRKLYELCDAAVVLPGGFGTLDELFEMLTWNQLSIHNKRIFLVNSDGFYDHLFAHLQNIANAGFLYDPLEERITILQQPSALNQYLL